MEVDKIVRLINTNFTKDDLLVYLTYKSESKPTLEEAKRDIQEYITRIKRYRYENGLEDLKYLFVIRPKDKRKGISHKILINSMDEKVAEDLWDKGHANAGRLNEDDSIEITGRYITKDLKDLSNCGSSKFEEKHNHKDKKETSPEVPVQEQFLKLNEISINAADFEKLIALIGVIIRPIDFTKKFKIELNYDPENPRAKMEYFKSKKEIVQEANNNKKTAGIENQVQLEKLYESKLENGVKLNVSISAKIENLNQEIFLNDVEKNIHEILQSFSISTRNFYLLFGNEIKNKLL